MSNYELDRVQESTAEGDYSQSAATLCELIARATGNDVQPGMVAARPRGSLGIIG